MHENDRNPAKITRSIPVPKPAQADHAIGLVLEFARTRTKIYGVHSANAQNHASAHGFRHALIWAPGAQAEPEIEIEFDGAVPHLVSERPLLGGSGVQDLLEVAQSFLGDSQSVEEVFQERWHFVEQVQDPQLQKLMKSFYWIDYKSHAVIARKTDPELADAIHQLHAELPTRSLLRAYAKLHHSKLQRPSKDSLEAMRRVDGMLRPLLSKEFGDGATLDPRALFDGFLAFVSGDLNLVPFGAPPSFLTQGSPDGSLFFCFAEFALTCVEYDIETEFWKQTLATFVGCSDAFVELYWHGGGRGQHDYSCFFRGDRNLPAARRQFIRCAFQDRKIARLTFDFEVLLLNALRDQVHAIIPPRHVADPGTKQAPSKTPTETLET